MPRKVAALTATKVAKAGPGRYGDGNGLYLLVRPNAADGSPGGRFWLFRYVIAGKMREMGLGRAPGTAKDEGAVSLADARVKAGALHKTVKDGIDPLEKRAQDAVEAKAEAQRQALRRKTLKDVGAAYIAAHEAG